ncbi:hypothetical protein H7F51_07580 [Novosphingobium flavum]|uniref:Uncharacterized protein n=1 Tax=Novosphingobium flavum TaxID=1778672 RepID=A0A7X1FS67_9SPHN|nr:hypothetical protein [Novosphingobium flavum]
MPASRRPLQPCRQAKRGTAADRCRGALKEQLPTGGRLISPARSEHVQSLRQISRTGARHWEEEDLGACRFVPLIGRERLPEW